MIRTFHEIRRHEEGQALILAAICMLILALCVLATVNLSYVASQKVRLQNAADAGAYSVAAYQARAMNFFAYSNRTMVVHYASQMTMMAVMSYLLFCIGVWNALAAIPIPYVQIVFQVIAVIITVFYVILQIAVAVAMPFLDGINLGLWAAQNGISEGMLARTGIESLQEVRGYNPEYVLTDISGESQETSWRSKVDVRSFPRLDGPRTDEAQLDRAVMTEIINSARNPWTAFGMRQIQVMLIPRELYGSILGMDIGKVARTEYGQLAPGASRQIKINIFGIPIPIINVPVTEEIFSVDQFVARITLANLVGIEFIAESWVSADRLFGEANFGRRNGGEHLTPICNLSWPFDALCRTLLRAALASVNAAISGFMQQIRPAAMLPVNFHFGQLPYARFRPVASGEAQFSQPSVALIVTHPTNALVQRARPYMNNFGVRLGAMTSAASPLMQRYGSGSQASNRGFRTSTDFRLAPERYAPLPEGLQAASAALAYYHRPGDWREPPNLFNPLWGAKLLPILDHPAAREHPAIAPFAGANRLVVH